MVCSTVPDLHGLIRISRTEPCLDPPDRRHRPARSTSAAIVSAKSAVFSSPHGPYSSPNGPCQRCSAQTLMRLKPRRLCQLKACVDDAAWPKATVSGAAGSQTVGMLSAGSSGVAVSCSLDQAGSSMSAVCSETVRSRRAAAPGRGGRGSAARGPRLRLAAAGGGIPRSTLLAVARRDSRRLGRFRAGQTRPIRQMRITRDCSQRGGW